MEELRTKPCVGCGFCCLKAKCAAGVRLYRSSDICNALIWSKEKNRYYCDLMELPGILGETYREELYAGAGCCSNLNTWRQNVINRTEEKKEKIINIGPLFQIFLKAMGREMISGDSLYLMISGFETELKSREYSDKEILEIKKSIVHHIKNNRSKMYDNFMGELKL